MMMMMMINVCLTPRWALAYGFEPSSTLAHKNNSVPAIPERTVRAHLLLCGRSGRLSQRITRSLCPQGLVKVGQTNDLSALAGLVRPPARPPARDGG